MKHSNLYISQLIAKSVTGELTGEEKAHLESWLENENNQKFFQDLMSQDRLKAKEQSWKSAPTEEAYKRLMSRVMSSEQSETSKKTPWKRYLVAAVFAGVVAMGAYWYKQQQEAVVNYQVVKTLKAPDNGATLVLGDGTRVNLESVPNAPDVEFGEATYHAQDHSLEYGTEKSEPQEQITYNTLIVPRGGMYRVKLPDGSKVWVNANTELKYPVKFPLHERRVSLQGEAYFEVEKDKKQFIVETQGGEITVLGTSFNVSAYPEEKIVSSTLVEGSVRLSSKFSTADKVEIVPGERAALDYKNYRGIEVKGVDVRHYVSWIEGKEYFVGMTLGEILQVASRWYDFDVTFAEEDLKEIPFTGVMYREHNLERLMDLVAQTSGVEYEIRKDTVQNKYQLMIMKP